MWVNIPYHLLFEYNPPQPVFHMVRRLRLNDPRGITKYLTYLHISMVDHDQFHRMNDLHRRTVCPLPNHLAKEYKAIDRLVCKLMNEAELQCWKLHTGRIPWSSTCRKICQTIEYWLNRRSHKQNLHINIRQLIVLKNKLKFFYNPDISLQEIGVNI